LGLNGHVVASIEDDGVTYALDPDFGVGPLRYDGKHDDEIARVYRAVISDSPTISNLVIQAFLTRDDNLKISVKMLEKVEQLQSEVIRSAEIVRAAIGALGIVCLGFGIAILFRRKLKPARG
jgi:hypothetical protein